MEKLAFIAAMRLESRPFLRRAGRLARSEVAGFPCYRFGMWGRDCLLVESGIGLTHAISSTRALLSLGRPSLLVSFGVAGSPGPTSLVSCGPGRGGPIAIPVPGRGAKGCGTTVEALTEAKG